MSKFKYMALAAATTFPLAAFAGGTSQPIPEPMIAPPAPVVMAPSTDWTGAYAGASLGFGRVNAAGGDKDATGGAVGLNLGYRKDYGSFVLGGELGLAKNDVTVDRGSDQINSTANAQVMLGADLGKTLVYGSAGVARANATLGNVSGYDNGYTLGIGADYLLNDRLTLGAELKSSTFDDFKNSGTDLKDTSLGMKVGMRF